MDELYVESFSKREVVAPKVIDVRPVQEKPVVEIYEFNNQMHYHLDQLEAMLTNDLKDISNLKFVIERVKKKINDKDLDAALNTLFELEELMDIVFPILSARL